MDFAEYACFQIKHLLRVKVVSLINRGNAKTSHAVLIYNASHKQTKTSGDGEEYLDISNAFIDLEATFFLYLINIVCSYKVDKFESFLFLLDSRFLYTIW